MKKNNSREPVGDRANPLRQKADKARENRHVSASTALDDEQRIKVLSPGMLVFNRFIRNKLAITGVIFIGLMFLFSFVGGWVMPYDEAQVFTKYVSMSKDYAALSSNTEYKITTVDGSDFPMIARSQFVLAVNNQQADFSAQDVDYGLEALGGDLYMIYGLSVKADAILLGKAYTVTSSDGSTLPDAFQSAFLSAIESGQADFSYGGTQYTVIQDKKNYRACISEPVAFASMNVFDFASASADSGFDFKFAAESALLNAEQNSLSEVAFTAGGNSYTISVENGVGLIYDDQTGEEYANLSPFTVQTTYSDIFLTLDFKNAVKEYVNDGVTEFTYVDSQGVSRDFTIVRNNLIWTVKWVESTLVIDDYASPSFAHPMGTDANGMDLLTRLMFGGRISLMIGFIVVALETFLGVILGGVAGYFGKWLDNLLMRIVDIFNCIPSLPLIIILGAIMDSERVDPQLRMVYLMLVLGFLGWPGIARLVRGQILFLREQEFMVATEATGLSVSRRIFRHLVPNVILQLIVICTMNLGSVILIESTLSFLGLGVKYPFASWGNIITAVSNVYVMTNYLFVWIPAGFCILITVLGFNFIGDGLRDAFDPKMKR